ncbi:MAG: hypothetical protein P0Y50_02230 [Candidatus Brevundimonas colombiensis]|uniref:Uncharacterized protein n=1 Tax=Candidatus Brevundimonas colombiensis TaxID=3121376 RepID=A0AAJ6BK15_9CAUL|nr:hypothetical protein [Brevundimonas sp.]WEK40445.1 MAG: hypothetical protein P0Y50_02230 [Brevundimonas sp.]
MRVTKARQTQTIDPNSSELKLPLKSFVEQFVKANATVNESSEAERSWYFEERTAQAEGGSGYVHYGTFGFESNFVDSKTKKRNYRRKTTDVEEIPLFYQAWFPDSAKYGLVAFQSFQGRSCVALVTSKMQKAFAQQNDGFVLRFRKLLPVGKAGGLYAQSPVKELRLVRRNAPSDVTDRYLDETPEDPIDFEVSMRARRKGTLGKLQDILGSLKANDKGLVMHDGIAFDRAVADVRIGRGTRPVNLLGSAGEAGVIDLTETVSRGPDGHPVFDSLASEVDEILIDFFKTLSGK